MPLVIYWIMRSGTKNAHMKEKVFILTSADSLDGGVGTYVRDLMSIVEQDVAILTGPTDRFSDDVDVVTFDGIRRIPTLSALYSLTKFLRSQMRTGKPLVVANSSAGLFISIFIRLFARVPTICVYHGLASKYEGWKPFIVEYLSDKLSSQSVFLNTGDRAKLSSNGVIIPSFVDDVGASPAASKGDIICVARHTKQKNIRLLLDAATYMPEHSITIFGGGAELSDNRKLAAALELKNVTMTEYEDRARIYSNRSVFVLPTFSEGFPLAALEAASAGIPLLLSDIPEHRSAFMDSAVYFGNDDPEELSKLILQLKEDPDYYGLRSKAALNLKSIYTREKWTQTWQSCIASIISENGPSSKHL